MTDLFDIDGSVLEGGGQILRVATSLSVLQRIPIRVRNIRAGRSKPGLRPQHAAGLTIVSSICSGKLDNAYENSNEITLYPGHLKPGKYNANIRTAGSVCLIFQVAFPCTLFTSGPTILDLCGGTDVDMAPPIDHTAIVFKSVLEKFGASFDVKIQRRGFFPKGNGCLTFTMNPVKSLNAVNMTEPGSVKRIWGISYFAGFGRDLMKVMAQVAKSELKRQVPGVPIDISELQLSPAEAFANGNGIRLFAETTTGCVLGASGLGAKVPAPEKVAKAAVDELVEAISYRSCVDQHTQDQVIILMAIANGTSRIKCGPITLHTRTAIHVSELLTKAKFTITEEGADSNIIECQGIGLINEYI